MRYKIEPVTCEEGKAGCFTSDLRKAIDFAKRMADSSGLSFAVYDSTDEIEAILDPAPAQ